MLRTLSALTDFTDFADFMEREIINRPLFLLKSHTVTAVKLSPCWLWNSRCNRINYDTELSTG